MATYNFKAIAPVPEATTFLDIVLSNLQRKTPTQIHKGFKISRIRAFYARKVKWSQQTFHDRLDGILTGFPQLDSLHPFYSSLLNVLYDKNHYKLALGQLNTARHLIDSVARDYVRLLKYGDSMYRCKQLKRAALGRMATIIRRQKEPLAYLEQVRQHLARLPSIDPTTRTLVICGYPNVGKSSFINKITRADVDVQPYAFTTKSLFVGHMDYNYLRWQVIDTPGILDHPLEEMNTIEMQSITALAHLRAAILYFFDLSEQCGYPVDAQIKLYQSIKPLFANKTVICVLNKADIMTLAQLPQEQQEAIRKIQDVDGAQLLESSCYTDQGIINVRNVACDSLLASRVDHKVKTNKVTSVLNKIHVAQPARRDQVERSAFVPPGAAARARLLRSDSRRRRTEKDLEEESGGAGVYSADYQKSYLLAKDDWKYDDLPHIMEGKNVADFIDPDIVERLEALEKEEEELEAKGFYDETEDILDDDEIAERAMHKRVQDARLQAILTGREKKRSRQNVAPLPRNVSSKSSSGAKTYQEMIKELKGRGLDTTALEKRAKAAILAQKTSARDDEDVDEMQDDQDDMASINSEDFEDSDDDGAMELDEAPKKPTTAQGLRKQIAFMQQNRGGEGKGRSLAGLRDRAMLRKATALGNMAQRKRNLRARRGEADRHETAKLQKHLLAGKRTNGTANHR